MQRFPRLQQPIAEDPLWGNRPPRALLTQEKPEHRQVQELAAAGYRTSEIASMVGMNNATVRNVIRQPFAQDRITKVMKETAKDEIAAMLERAAPESIKRMISRAGDPELEPKLRQGVDEYIVDRYLGKAVQPICQGDDDLKKLTDREVAALASGETAA